MLGLSPLFWEGIIHDLDKVPFMYYEIPSNDSEQLDLPLSSYIKYYTKFAPLHPEDDPQLIIWTEGERLKIFYSKNALPQKEVWSKKRITKIAGCGRKILTKFQLNCVLFRYYIFRNKPTQYTITDVDFPAINLNDILPIATHLQSHQNDSVSMGAYHTALSFLKDYVAQLWCDYELAHLFGTENFLAKIDYVLPEVDLLTEGPIDETMLGFVYKQRKTNKKDFFRVLDEHLVPTKGLQKFISGASTHSSFHNLREG